MREIKNWTKIEHIKSSMQKKDEQFNLFIGRWQPLHSGHQELFKQVLDKGEKVLIAIRDMPTDEKNPYTASEVMANICKHYENNILLGNVRVMILPDICSVNFGRGVGYDIVEFVPPSDIAAISATKIRENATN
jgi:cytidyltransferase-like protein